MKRIINSLLIPLSAVMLAGCAGAGSKASPADLQKRQQALAASDHLIVPGQRIGPVRLGMGMDEVAATLGQPDITRDFTGNMMWRYISLNLEVSFSTGAAPSVSSITAIAWSRIDRTYGEMTWDNTEPVNMVFRTANGIALGSSSFEAKRAYSSYGYVEQTWIDMNYKQLGIHFTVGKDHRIWSINVYQPGQ